MDNGITTRNGIMNDTNLVFSTKVYLSLQNAVKQMVHGILTN
jgi:hypothetical protein